MKFGEIERERQRVRERHRQRQKIKKRKQRMDLIVKILYIEGIETCSLVLQFPEYVKHRSLIKYLFYVHINRQT